MKNNVFNLINQLNQELKSAYRIREVYLGEAGSSEETELWEAMLTSKETYIANLTSLAKSLM